MKNACCRQRKTVEEREREMNDLEKKKEKRNDNKKEEKKKDEKKEEKNSTPNEKKIKKEEDISWEDRNKLKKELNQQKPPPRQKKTQHTSINLIDLNTKEEAKEEKIVAEEKDNIMVDSVAIVIENV